MSFIEEQLFYFLSNKICYLKRDFLFYTALTPLLSPLDAVFTSLGLVYKFLSMLVSLRNWNAIYQEGLVHGLLCMDLESVLSIISQSNKLFILVKPIDRICDDIVLAIESLRDN